MNDAQNALGDVGGVVYTIENLIALRNDVIELRDRVFNPFDAEALVALSHVVGVLARMIERLRHGPVDVGRASRP